MNVLCSVRTCSANSSAVHPRAGSSTAPANPIDRRGGVARLEVVHQVAQSQHAAGGEQVVDPRQRYGLPEVGHLMQHVAGEDESGRRAVVPVAQQAGRNHGDVVEAALVDGGAERGDHRRRHVDRDDASGAGLRRQR